jgi:hypothetical protein
MKISATYKEIETLVKRETGESISLKMVTDNTVSVGYTRQLGPFSPSLSANVRVESIHNAVISCCYSSGKATEILLSVVKNILAKKDLGGIVQFADGNRVLVNLANIDGAQEVLKKIALQNLSFNPECAVAEAVLL